MTDVRVMIVEDDPFFSSMLTDLFNDHFPYIRVCHAATSILEARQYLLKNRIDLLFLDVELPDGKGFDLLSSMEEVNFEVIITTSHSSYALEAIRHSALDYLLKPVGQSEMSTALEKFLKKFNTVKQEKQNSSNAKPAFKKLPLPTVEGYVFVDIDDIINAVADRAYAVFSLKSGNSILVSKPLGDFAERLIHHDFFRVHKSHIINLHEVSKYVRGEGGHIVMSNGETIPVSRNRKEDFLKMIGN